MRKNFTIYFEDGLPKGTAQQKGEKVCYKRRKDGSIYGYVHHYKKEIVRLTRREFVYRLGKYAPAMPSEKPVRLMIWVCFDVKNRNLWGKYKTTRPDCDDWAKEFIDALGEVGFFLDDSQVVDLRVVKTYAEKASVSVQIEDLGAINKIKGAEYD